MTVKNHVNFWPALRLFRTVWYGVGVANVVAIAVTWVVPDTSPVIPFAEIANKVLGGVWFAVTLPLALLYIYQLSTNRGPLRAWFYFLFAAPFLLFMVPAAALSMLNPQFGFHPIPWPKDVWYKIQLDFALNGALFDFAESLGWRVTDFEPKAGKWAFALIEIFSRTMWQAWSAGTLYQLYRLIRARLNPERTI